MNLNIFTVLYSFSVFIYFFLVHVEQTTPFYANIFENEWRTQAYQLHLYLEILFSSLTKLPQMFNRALPQLRKAQTLLAMEILNIKEQKLNRVKWLNVLGTIRRLGLRLKSCFSKQHCRPYRSV